MAHSATKCVYFVVVALLKSAGASPKLTILIVGESLLNDGVALVLFELFLELLNGHTFTAADIVVFALRAVLGSCVVGLAFGVATIRWLRSAKRPLRHEDITIQIAVTISSAYLCFFTAQYSFGMSGVLSCGAAGVVIAALGPPVILDQKAMHSVWSIMEWSFNTLIFLLAGLILGHRKFTYLSPIDWLLLPVLYLMLMLVRVFVLTIFYPVVSRIGHKLSLPEAIFMSWAGLRGALAIVLGLIVQRGTDGDDDLLQETDRLFFYCGGIAAMTLFINATTAKLLLKKLGLIGKHSIEKNLVVTSIKRKLLKHMEEVALKLSEKYSDSHLQEAKAAISLLNEEDDEHESQGNSFSAISTKIWRGSDVDRGSTTNNPVLSTIERPSNSEERATVSRPSRFSVSVQKNDANFAQLSRVNNFLHGLNRTTQQNQVVPEVLSYVRSVFLEIVRAQYWHEIESGRLPRLSHSAQFLLYSIDVGLDHLEETSGAQDWTCIKKEIESKFFGYGLLVRGEKSVSSFVASHCTTLIARLEALQDKRAVYILESFISAHEAAQEEVHSFLVEADCNNSFVPPEETKVVEESKRAVSSQYY